MAMLIPAVGPPRAVVPADGRTFTLAELQALVGGYIEALATPDGRLAFLNEDGKRLGLARNAFATGWFAAALRPGDMIVGDVVVCSFVEAGQHDDEADDDEASS